jgi:hypothetical protein
MVMMDVAWEGLGVTMAGRESVVGDGEKRREERKTERKKN